MMLLVKGKKDDFQRALPEVVPCISRYCCLNGSCCRHSFSLNIKSKYPLFRGYKLLITILNLIRFFYISVMLTFFYPDHPHIAHRQLRNVPQRPLSLRFSGVYPDA